MSTTTLELYSNKIEEASRPIYWNLPSILNQVVMYVLLVIASIIFLNAIIQRMILWNSSAREKKLTLSINNIFAFLSYVLLQKKTHRDKKAGIFHILLYIGFIILLVTTTTVFLHHDFNLEIYKGHLYIALTLLSDAFGALMFIAVMLALHRRYIEKPDKLHSSIADSFMLYTILALVVQGFILEGLRIHSTGDPWATYSFVGLMVSYFFWPLSQNATSGLHFLTWWIHTVTVFLCIALIPYTKIFHIIASSLNLILTDYEKTKATLPQVGDLEKIMENALSSENQEFSIGISTQDDLTWKQRLDVDACTSCGRCQDVCPAYNSGKILSPKFLILDTRDHLLKSYVHKEPKNNILRYYNKLTFLKKIDSFLVEKLLLQFSSTNTEMKATRASSPLVQNSVGGGFGIADSLLAGEVMDENVFWSCTTCRACQEVCPVNIEHVDYIMEVRRNLVLMQGKAPSEALHSLRLIESQGTVLGNQQERADWTQGMNIHFVKPGDTVDYLYWVGCISSFDTRKQEIAKSVVSILNASGLHWGMLGNLEKCTGDPARRIGDENTFQTLAKSNISILREISFNTIVTHCPHCFNSLKNDYPEFGSLSDTPHRVIHHTTLITELMKTGKLQINDTFKDNVTFHDPCYLGRYNEIYEEPREILVQIGTRKIIEMKDNKTKSKCCGAGGGHYLFDLKVGERVNVQRVQQALETGAHTIASACPFCMQMLEDGIKLTNTEDTLVVKDIAELVKDHLIS